LEFKYEYRNRLSTFLSPEQNNCRARRPDLNSRQRFCDYFVHYQVDSKKCTGNVRISYYCGTFVKRWLQWKS